MKSASILVALGAVAHAEPALSYERLYARAGVVHLSPHTSSHELVLSGVQGPASLAISNGPIPGSGAAIDPATTFAVIVGYVLPVLHDRLSIETVLGAPLHVTFRATGSLADMSIAPEALGLPTGVPALGSRLGEAQAIPPLVTAVYRPFDLGPVHPYAGGGVGFLIARDAKATNPVLTAVGQPTLSIAPSAGLVLQTGIDVHVWRRVFARIDVKYIAFLHAHATVDHIAVATPGLPLFGQAMVGTATMDMTVNPLIVQAGLGVDF